MKILMVNNRYAPFGGAEALIRNMEVYLSALGHQVDFFSTECKNYYNNNYEFKNFFPKINNSSLNYIKHPFNYYYNKEALNSLSSLIDIIKPDVIHLHAIGEFTYSILHACKDIPTVMTIHSVYMVFCPILSMLKNGVMCKDCKKGNYLPCIKNRCANGKFGRTEASIRAALRAYSSYYNFKNIDMFITPSDALRKNVLEYDCGIDERRILTIPNFLSKEIYEITPNYENKKYFVYAGRLYKGKGIHILLQALNELPREIEMHIAGTGPDEEALKQYAKQNNLVNVKFLGQKNREDLFDEYQNCIANIVPSIWFENFPTANMESFINGKPVIASNIGGIPEQVEHNVNGLLFEPGNVQQLKEHIMTYWNNPQLAVEHGQNGYRKAKENYSEESYYNKIIKVYEDVINEYAR